jgi:hypothetical protein
MHLNSPDRDRIHHQPVKAEGFRGPRHRPPASNPSQALCPTIRRRMVERQTPFRSRTVSHPRTRPPSPTPAATKVASLGPTLLADFCNQNRARAHRSNDRTPPEVCFRTPQHLGRLPSVGSEQHGPETEVPGRHQSRRLPYWPRAPESACTQRCRGPLERTRTPHGRRFLPGEPGKPTGPGKRPRPPARPVARTTEALERTEVLCTARTPHRRATSVRSPHPLPNRAVGKSTPSPWCLGSALTCRIRGIHRQIAPSTLGSNQRGRYALRRP